MMVVWGKFSVDPSGRSSVCWSKLNRPGTVCIAFADGMDGQASSAFFRGQRFLP